MQSTLYWLQLASCGGDSMSLLGSQSPDLPEVLQDSGVAVMWHPSLSNASPATHARLLQDLLEGVQPLDILCVEGAVVRGPGGTGMFDTLAGKPKKDIAARLAARAQHVVAVGTCASYGGIPAIGATEATGLQFDRDVRGGFLGADFVGCGGLPVINLPGCPAHPQVLCDVLTDLARGVKPALDAQQQPREWYSMLVHQGCTRNEYHEFRIEEEDFGAPGCLFFHLGCLGPLTYGPCNKLLWAGRTSRTRVGVPCVGCMRSDFPRPHPFFETRQIEDVPLDLPDGVDRAHFLAYKIMAEAAAPERLKRRATKV